MLVLDGMSSLGVAAVLKWHGLPQEQTVYVHIPNFSSFKKLSSTR